LVTTPSDSVHISINTQPKNTLLVSQSSHPQSTALQLPDRRRVGVGVGVGGESPVLSKAASHPICLSQPHLPLVKKK